MISLARFVLAAVARGDDVYLFLGGMMVLAEIARTQGVFDWLASHALQLARGSCWRLFIIVYGVGIVVTIVLSNDATAVVLTPVVAVAVRQAKADPLPFLFGCAFVANAASFVLPISNPANLVVFERSLPTIQQWVTTFAAPSIVAIGVTFAVLSGVFRRSLRTRIGINLVPPAPLQLRARWTLIGIATTAMTLAIASGRGASLGLLTAICATSMLLAICARQPRMLCDILGAISWNVLALVAGLFVFAAFVDTTDSLVGLRQLCAQLIAMGRPWSIVTGGFVVGVVSNVITNLPAGLVARSILAAIHGQSTFRAAVDIGIDLGPNLSISGSLATILWLGAVRREHLSVNGWTFLMVGSLVMPPALLLALATLSAMAT